MNYAINLLQEEIKELERKRDTAYKGQENYTSGTSTWNGLDKSEAYCTTAIEQCKKALEWIIANN